MKNQKFKLSNSTIRKIRQLEKEVKKPRLLKRLQFLLMKNKGDLHKNIAELLGVTKDTLTGWLKKYQHGGLKELLGWNYYGKTPRLSKEQREILRDRMRHNGFVNAQEAKEFIEKRFGVVYHLNHVQKVLKKIRIIIQTTSSHSRQSTR
jgi:transposase